MKATIISIDKNSIPDYDAKNTVQNILVKQNVDILGIFSLVCHKQKVQNIIKTSFEYSDLVVVLCSDDAANFVKNEIAKNFDDELEQNVFAKNFVTSTFYKNAKPNKNQLQHTIMPKTARAVLNKLSSFCGFVMQNGDKNLFFLPNRADEVTALFDSAILPMIEHKTKKHSLVFQIFGLTNEEVFALLKVDEQILANNDCDIKIIDEYPQSQLCVRYSQKTPKVVLDDLSVHIANTLNDFIITSKNQTMSSIIVEILQTRKKTCSIIDGLSYGALTKALVKKNSEGHNFFTHNTIFTNKFDKTKKQDDQMYMLALEALKSNKTDYCVCIFEDIEDKHIFYVVVGDKENIHIFKEAYNYPNVHLSDYATKTAMFYFFKKLKFGN